MTEFSPSQITLTAEEQDEFRSLASALADYDPVTETEQYVLAAQLAAGRLPKRIRRAAAAFNRAGTAAGGLLVRNLPVEPLPPTPDHADHGMGIQLPSARVFSV